MSRDELLLDKVLEALKKVRLEAILVGNVAAVLQGVPVMTHDFDFFIRDTEINRKKIKEFARLLNLTVYKRDEAISEVITVEGKELSIDFIFRFSPGEKFESIKSRAKKIRVGKFYCLVADLQDILKSKKHANRPKDLAVIRLIEDTIKVKDGLKKFGDKSNSC
jgi:PP-loop superfamily ATP-utilizing enzyme